MTQWPENQTWVCKVSSKAGNYKVGRKIQTHKHKRLNCTLFLLFAKGKRENKREREREAGAHSNNKPSPQIKAHNELEQGNN